LTQAQQFTKELRERKIASTTEVIGRAPVQAEKSQRGLDAVTAADRILAVLLQIPDVQERINMVAEAFIPPETDATEVESTLLTEIVLRFLPYTAFPTLNGDS